jgi:hypothetical protein
VQAGKGPAKETVQQRKEHESESGKETIVMRRGVLAATLGVCALLLPLQTTALAFEGMGIGAQVPSGTDVLWKVWLSPSFAAEPFLAFSHYCNDDRDATDFGFGLSAYSYTASNKRVSPFFGLRLGVAVHSNEESDTTILVAPLLGAEYFVTQNIGVGAKVALDVAFGSLSINTQSGMFAYYYF